jgi:hypothetical protein
MALQPIERGLDICGNVLRHVVGRSDMRVHQARLDPQFTYRRDGK